MTCAAAQENYPLRVRFSEVVEDLRKQELKIPAIFSSQLSCTEYINRLPGRLQALGYVTASVDSVRIDSAGAEIVLFVGELYKWAILDVSGTEPVLLQQAGWKESQFANKAIDMALLKQLQERILNRLENTGYPFAKVYLDSLVLNKNTVAAKLKTEKGPYYTIDSIRLYSNVRISNHFLQRYLDIPAGSAYNQEKIINISRKIRELAFVTEEKPPDMSLLATGSVLNLYLKSKKSSQVNVLIGLLPSNQQLNPPKLLLTGEANILLHNALGTGETMGLNWQQVQVRSPRLNIALNFPYLLRSAFGVDFLLDILKKDSSYVNIQMMLGTRYALAGSGLWKLFFQRFQTIVSAGGINTAQVLATRRLPDIADVSLINAGLEYELNKTDYRFNPRRGTEIRLSAILGSKKIKKNSEITELKDPADPAFDFNSLYDTVKLNSYQFRALCMAALYIPLGKSRTTLKVGAQGGILQSGSVFRNELFQLGGFKLLRGFDEESQYFSHYMIGTMEFRYLAGQNSYFYVFLDGGWGYNSLPAVKKNYTCIGTGLGLALETKAGIFNIAWAAGSRNDASFNLRQSKIHFGFLNFF